MFSPAQFSTCVKKPLYSPTRWYSMTRKHFIAIAKILAKHDADLNMVRDFAGMCAEHNDRFNRETFIKACSME